MVSMNGRNGLNRMAIVVSTNGRNCLNRMVTEWLVYKGMERMVSSEWQQWCETNSTEWLQWRQSIVHNLYGMVIVVSKSGNIVLTECRASGVKEWYRRWLEW
jgi:hypothetical protein